MSFTTLNKKHKISFTYKIIILKNIKTLINNLFMPCDVLKRWSGIWGIYIKKDPVILTTYIT